MAQDPYAGKLSLIERKGPTTSELRTAIQELAKERLPEAQKAMIVFWKYRARDCREKPLECLHIALAVFQDGFAVIGIPRAARQNQIAHVGFLLGTHSGQAQVVEGTKQAVSVWHPEPVCLGAELRKQVEHTFRYSPTQGQKTSDFSARVIRDEQGLGAGVKRGRTRLAEFVLPQPDHPAAAEFLGDHADGDGQVSVCMVKLEIAAPDLAIREATKAIACVRRVA